MTRDMCFPGGGTDITGDTCFLGRGTHTTRDISYKNVAGDGAGCRCILTTLIRLFPVSLPKIVLILSTNKTIAIYLS